MASRIPENGADKVIAVNKEIATPLYSQIKMIMLQSIASGEYKVGERIPSEIELAKKYGVSRITTKQALNELMQEGIVDRVAGKGTFVRRAVPFQNDPYNSPVHPQPLQVRNVQSGSFGLIVPFMKDTYEIGIISGVEQELRDRDCRLIFRKTDNSIIEESKAIESLRNEGVQGLIIFPAEGMYCSEALLKLKLEQFPFVMVDRYYRGIECNYVVSDNFGGAYAAGEYLVRLGHKEFGLVGYQPELAVSINDRIQGFCQALADHGIPLPQGRKELSMIREQTYDRHTGQADPVAIQTVQAFLERNPQITAIFAINDYLAICILRAALQMGLSVPRDLSVMGFDNNILAANVEVPLTTVNQPKEEIGKSAARLLQRMIETENPATEHLVLPTELIVRASTASPRGKDGV